MTISERLNQIADWLNQEYRAWGEAGMTTEGYAERADELRALAAECEQKVLVATSIQEHLGCVASDPPDVIYHASIAMFVSPHTDGGGLSVTEALNRLQQRLNKEAFARGWKLYKEASKG